MMSGMVNIEFLDDKGSWKRYSTVPNDTNWIERAVQAAAADPRAVDARVVEEMVSTD